jgi:hypothetical protein
MDGDSDSDREDDKNGELGINNARQKYYIFPL